MSKASKKHYTPKLQETLSAIETMLQLFVRTANARAVPMEERIDWAKVPIVVGVCVCVHMHACFCVSICMYKLSPPFVSNDWSFWTGNTKRVQMLNKIHCMQTNTI